MPRQYYAKEWKYEPKAKYYYKTYNYKPMATAKVYKQQYVVYKPMKDKSYVYWYNPDKKVYWARCPTVKHKKYGKEVKKGKDYWSIAVNKKASLDEVKDEDYGKVTEDAPPVPESMDKVTISCPPSDLPPDLPPG
jgi:hypothetical protein